EIRVVGLLVCKEGRGEETRRKDVVILDLLEVGRDLQQGRRRERARRPEARVVLGSVAALEVELGRVRAGDLSVQLRAPGLEVDEIRGGEGTDVRAEARLVRRDR